MTKFPKTIAAFKTYANDLKLVEGKDLWAVADAMGADLARLMGQEARRRASHGVNDGSRAFLAELATELGECGYRNPSGDEYSISFLRKLEWIAEAFPKSRRHRDLTLNMHEEAGTPDVLDFIVKHKPATGITIRYIRNCRIGMAERQARKADEKTGKSDTPPPKRRDIAPPEDEEGPTVIRELEVLGLAREAKALGLKAVEQLKDISLDLDMTAINVIVEHIGEVVTAWQTARELAKKTATNRRSHLSVVGE